MLGAWCLVLAAIQLTGVEGTGLRARAFFDANNVKRGDPMVLTIDFLGEADFKDLHPPALAKAVGPADWKLYDESAKTDTFRDARRLTYRIRPKHEGVLWFPALEFEYVERDGSKRIVRSNEIPVHVKEGAQVDVGELGEETGTSEMPQPPALVAQPGVPLSDDEAFAWRRAQARPTADGFAAFDFPAAKLNEATCAIREGNWARAFGIYRKLEWRIGQTPEIECGLVAAQALQQDNPEVELPVWRQVLRPLLRFGWQGRVALVLGGFALLALVFWLLGRGIRAVACVALTLGLVVPADAQGLFEQMERQMRQMQQQMQQSFGGGFGFGFGGAEERERVRISAALSTSKPTLQVGDPFEFVVSLEYPKTASVGEIRLTPSVRVGLTFTGPAQNLTDGKSENPTNVVKRIALPVRYDVPFRGKVSFAIEGMVSERASRGRMVSFSFSSSFRSETAPLAVDVKPLPTANQPDDFGGIISAGLRLHETCDILTVETNDVVTITYRMAPNGYVPDGFLPKDAAFEWAREADAQGRVTEIVYRRYFVADGARQTPKVSVSYYDPRTKSYRRVTCGGTPLKYAIIP